MADELTVKVEPFGPDQRAVDRIERDVRRHPAARELIGGANRRLLAVEPLEPARRSIRPRPWDRYRATWYDYGENRAIVVEGRLGEPGRVTTKETAAQPVPSPEEFEAAVAVVAQDPELGPAVRDGKLQPYRAMPPLVNEELPDGRVERTLTVGLLPADGAADARHEIVGVNMIRRQVERYQDRAPAGARATEELCGPPSANQSTTGQGVPGQARITVLRGSTRLWSLVAVRPSASSGIWGSGVELRSVYYRGRPVMHQAHVPVLNVRYHNDQCGPFRDPVWQEDMFQARGRNTARAFRLCSAPAKTILDTGSDFGNFRGVAVYVAGQEVVLVSELQAGWYRYVSEWRLHADGTIRPRFGFDATADSCVCIRHVHHAYWRFDFTVQTSGNNLIFEHNDPPLQPGTNVWQPQPFEIRRLRDPARKRRWRVQHADSGRGYTIIPGANDGTAKGDSYAKGDVWLLRYRRGQIDDEPLADGNTAIQIDRYLNRESIHRQDVVVWYGAHFTHDPHHEGAAAGHGHIVGPDLVPRGW
jgi:Copper amine oxidase, enzyme domain